MSKQADAGDAGNDQDKAKDDYAFLTQAKRYHDGEITWTDLTTWIKTSPLSPRREPTRYQGNNPTEVRIISEDTGYPEPGTTDEIDAANDLGFLTGDEHIAIVYGDI